MEHDVCNNSSRYICLIGNAQGEHQCSKHSAQIIDSDYEKWLKQNKVPNNWKELNGDYDLNDLDTLFDKVKCILKPWISLLIKVLNYFLMLLFNENWFLRLRNV